MSFSRNKTSSRWLLCACCVLGAAWLEASCRKPDDYQYVDDKAQEGGTTVVVTDENGNNTSLPGGATIGIYVVDENGNVTLRLVTVDGDGQAVLPSAPDGGAIIAYSPYQSAWGTAAFSTNPVFTVQGAQDPLSQYVASDLMIGVSRAGTRAGGSTMAFKHVMAKVTVNIMDETGSADLDSIDITLLNLKNSVTVDLPNQQVTTVELTRADIAMLTEIATAWRITSRAIVAPQAVAEGADFFAVKLFGKTQVYPIPQATTLEGGRNMTVNMRLTEVVLVPDGWYIADWDNVDAQDIET